MLRVIPIICCRDLFDMCFPHTLLVVDARLCFAPLWVVYGHTDGCSTTH